MMSTPWTEAIAVRRQWSSEADDCGHCNLEARPASDVAAWVVDLEGELERYYHRARGQDEGDPREALINLIAVAGAAVDAMGATT